MFATLAGGYPWPADPIPDALAEVIGAQVEAGFGLLADGRVHAASSTPADLVAAWRAARDAASAMAPDLPVKIAIEGPWGAAAGATSDPAAPNVAAVREAAVAAAVALEPALAALASIGCPLVEIHEPAATLPGDADGRAAFARAHLALLEGAAERIHASLAITGGDAVALGEAALFAAPYRSHLFDLLDGPDSWRLVALAPGERGIVVGVGDASGRRRTRLEDLVWAAGYAASTGGRGVDRVGLAPSGSLAGLPPERARAVLDVLGEAIRTIAGGSETVVARLDPRAIDARSAALGQYQPPPRRSRPRP